MVGVHDVITPFKFGDDRFRGFGLAEGQSLPFPIDFEGRLHTIVWGVISLLACIQTFETFNFLDKQLPLFQKHYKKFACILYTMYQKSCQFNFVKNCETLSPIFKNATS